jgi:hypothetical protein
VLGVSDFVGGVTTRRVAMLWVLLISPTVGLLIMVRPALLRGRPDFDVTAAAAVGGGLAGLIGIAALYRAIGLGVASLAEIGAATGTALPVMVGLLRGEPTSLPQEARCPG